MGYRYQFVTLAGFHALNAAMFELASGYADEGMAAYVRLQEHEFALEEHGYTATRHQREVGAGYFDAVVEAVSGGEASTLALKGSTEEGQFTKGGDGMRSPHRDRAKLRRPTDLAQSLTAQGIEADVLTEPDRVAATADDLVLVEHVLEELDSRARAAVRAGAGRRAALRAVAAAAR